MAEITYSLDRTANFHTLHWLAAGQGDTFTAFLLSRGTAHLMMQASGTFSGSAAIALEGSLDGTNFVALEDFQGDAVSLSAAGIVAVRSPPLYIRPALSSGDGSTAIDVAVVARYWGL